MELPYMSRRLHITSTDKKLGSLQGRTSGEKEGSLRPLRSSKEDHDEPQCWSSFGSIVEPLCSSKERKSRDRKCLGGKPKPYLRRVTPKAPRLLKTTHRVEMFRSMTNSLYQTAFFNAPESKQIFPTTM